VGVSESLRSRTRNGITELSQRAGPPSSWASVQILVCSTAQSTSLLLRVNVLCAGALRLWLLSEVLWMSEGRNCSDQQNSCYYELNHTSTTTHSDADASCRNLHGHLAAIWDSETQRRVEYLVRAKGGHYWIGGRLYITDQWTWVDGEPYSGLEALFPYVVFHPLLHNMCI